RCLSDWSSDVCSSDLLTILARISGLEVEGPPSSDIFPIESLIPKALETAQSGDEFVAGLPFHDAEFDEKRATAKQAGKVVRFVRSEERRVGKECIVCC